MLSKQYYYNKMVDKTNFSARADELYAQAEKKLKGKGDEVLRDE